MMPAVSRQRGIPVYFISERKGREKMGRVYEEKYEVKEELGSGGSGRVYKVYDRHLKCHMAMKEFKKENGISLKELEILKELKHPALPVVTDCMEDSEYRYLIMEYMEGKTLKEYLKEQGAVSEAQAVSWALELCDILIYLHERKVPVIYRDMKPANIIIDCHGKIRLIDFGTAYRLYHDDGESCLVIGTYGYAAPEQFETGTGKKDDERCDIYGLGATLFHMLTGCDPSRPPYLITPIRFHNEGLSLGLEKVVHKAVRQERDKRYQSVRAFKEDLELYKRTDYLKQYIGSGIEKAYNAFLFLSLLAVIYQCSQLGIVKGFVLYPALIGNAGIRRKLLELAVKLLLLCLGKKMLGGFLRKGFGVFFTSSRRDWHLIKNVLLTEKRGRGLFAFMAAFIGAAMLAGSNQAINVSAKEAVCCNQETEDSTNNLTVHVRNEKGQKILIKYDAIYMPENTFRLELPLSNFESGEEYELRLECTNRETKEKSSRTFYLKGLEP